MGLFICATLIAVSPARKLIPTMTVERAKSAVKKAGWGTVVGSMPLGLVMIYHTLQGIEKSTVKMADELQQLSVKLESVNMQSQYCEKQLMENVEELKELRRILDHHVLGDKTP